MTKVTDPKSCLQVASVQWWPVVIGLTVVATLPADTPDGTTASSFSEQERSHWAYQPIKRPPLPQVKQKDWVAPAPPLKKET